ncbi:MAG: alpha/beta hydrolase [Pseudomonadota bacterium]
MNAPQPIETHMAVHTTGSGPPMLLFHGGIGSWRHWVRNTPVWANDFTVHALDLPGYGDAGSVPKDITPEHYMALVETLIDERFGAETPLHFVGFSFGAAVASACAVNMGERVAAFTAIGPGGFGRTGRGTIDTRSYKGAKTDADFVAVMRHNLMAIMCLHSESVTDEVLEHQRANVNSLKGMDSRKVSLMPIMADNIGAMHCPAQLIYGQQDQVTFGGVNERIAACRAKRPDLRVDVFDNCGHWAMYEAADGVNQAVRAFHLAARG